MAKAPIRARPSNGAMFQAYGGALPKNVLAAKSMDHPLQKQRIS